MKTILNHKNRKIKALHWGYYTMKPDYRITNMTRNYANQFVSTTRTMESHFVETEEIRFADGSVITIRR